MCKQAMNAWLLVALAFSCIVAADAADVGLTAGTAQSTADWQTVVTGRTYTSMVVVCTPNYTSATPACVVRVRNVGADRFDFQVQRADGAGGALSGVTVHWLAAEQGVYTQTADGVKMEVAAFTSTVTDSSSSWSGEARTYAQAYTQPVVVGQVMTTNDADWSVFWCRGSKSSTPPNGTLRVGKHVGEDPDRTRANETIGYIVVEAGSGTVGSRAYTAGLGSDTLRGIDNGPPYTYSLTNTPTAAVAAVTQAGMDGGNGGWALLYGASPVAPTSLALAIDEDQANDTERKHTTEQAGYVVLSAPSAPPLQIADVTIAAPGTNVPKYEKIELDVTVADGSWSKPYEPDPAQGGLDLSATFTSPTSVVWHVHGFYDGAAWRVRFAPNETGTWSFAVTATDSSGSDTWTGGSFACTASAHPGWARIDGHVLRFAEGQSLFAVGHNTGWQDNVEQPTLANMAANGENLLSFWVAQPWAERSWLAARTPIENAEQGIGIYNQAACAYLDGVVQNAEAAGVYLLPTIWSHGQLRDANHPWSGASNHWWYNNAYSAVCDAADFFQTGSSTQWRYQKNFYRYLIARWGYSRAVAGWVGVCEIDGTTGHYHNSAEADAWCGEVASYFRTNDPFRTANGTNPMTASKTDTQSGDAASWDSGFDLRSADSYASQTDDVGVAATIASETQTMRASGKPCFHGEFGGNTSSGATQPTHLHNGIWAGAANGAAATPLVWCDGGGWPMLTAGMQAHLRILGQFMAAIDYLGDPGLAPAAATTDDANCLAWGMALADRGYAWVQNTNGTMGTQTLTISGLAAGQYTVNWYDAWTSGTAPIHSDPITVAADGILAAAIPTLAQADIACTFQRIPNQAPLAADDSYTTDEDTTLVVPIATGVLANDTDPDGQPLTAVLATDPEHGTLDLAPDGSFTYTPDPNYSGDDAFTYKAADGIDESNTATVAIAVNPVNDGPVANPQSIATNEDIPIAITLTGSDADGDPLTYALVDEPSHGSLSGTAPGLTYAPAADYSGPDSFTFKVNDGTADSAAATVSINVTAVNDPPVAANDSYDATEDVQLVIAPPGVLANDSDADGPQPLAAVLVAPPVNGVLVLALDGSFTYTPNPNSYGTDSFTYRASDGADESDIATVAITVASINDPPDAVDDEATTEEDQFVDIAVLVNDTDPDGDTLEITFVGTPLHGTATDNGDGIIRYIPNAGFTGSDAFTYTIGDGHDATDTANVHVTVTEVNDPPVADEQAVGTDEDTPLVINLTAIDPNGDGLIYLIVTDPAHGTLSGTPPAVTYTPDANWNGGDSFTFKANDGQADSNVATVSITVNPVNDAPVADDQAVGTNEDTGIAITLSGSDPDGDAIASYNVASQPANGTLSGTPPNLTYTPDPNWYGEDSFTFTVSDGTLGSAPATVTITVASVNDLPEASDQDVETDEDTPVAIVLSANDVETPTLTYHIVAQPAHGSLSGTAPNLTYTPAPDYNGPDSFTFKANDGQADSNVATITITVDAVNDAPTAAADAYSLDQDTTLNVAAPGVLGNDSDIEGDPLTAVLLTTVSHGSLSLDADGSFTYTPTAGFSGPDSFTYAASDGTAQSEPTTVTITVQPSAPTAVINIGLSVQSFWRWWRCTATVTVTDLSGTPIADAVVEGHWSNVYSANVSGTTDKNGVESWRSSWISSSGTLVFTVDRVSKGTQDYILTGETSDSVGH